MDVLIVAATQGETEPAMKFFQGKATHPHLFEFYTTGVGLTATAAEITRLAMTHSPDLIIQAGIAGSFRKEYPIGEVVMVQSEMIGDMGVWEQDQWKNMTDLSLLPANAFPYQQSLIPNPYLNSFDFLSLPLATAISVNQITTDERMIRYWEQHETQPAIESMEGAALHDACRRLQLPFLQLRAVSNQVGDRNKSNWNIPLAIDRLNQVLIRLLTRIEKESLHFSTPISS